MFRVGDRVCRVDTRYKLGHPKRGQRDARYPSDGTIIELTGAGLVRVRWDTTETPLGRRVSLLYPDSLTWVRAAEEK